MNIGIKGRAETVVSAENTEKIVLYAKISVVVCAENAGMARDMCESGGMIFMADDFSFEITEKLGVLSTAKSGWTLELNKVSWGGRPAKYDIRSWAPEHEKMGKGVTLNNEEFQALKKLVSGI